MHKTCDIMMEKNILEENCKLAERNAQLFKKQGVRAFNILGAIGSGKTTMIERLSEGMPDVCVGAIAGDLAGKDDHDRLKRKGIPVVAVNTGKDCHLDAHYVSHALEELPLEDIDVLFIENVGNLICPVDFPLGTELSVVIISVTEGDDMVRKHPLIFSQSEISVLNKIDLAEIMDVDIGIIEDDFKRINPHGKLIKTDARTGAGLEELSEALMIDYGRPL